MNTHHPEEKNQFERLLFGSRRIVLIPVIGSLLASIISMVMGGIVIVKAGFYLFARASFNEGSVKELSVLLIEVIDLFLLGTVFYIVAVGLYTLFVNTKIEFTGWLQIPTLDNLKAKLLGVVIVLLAVTFLGQVVQWKQGVDILYLGAAVGIVLAALSVLLNFGSKRNGDHPLQ